MTTPAAWYADPADASKLRWWDGGAWTTRVADRPSIIPNPPAPPAATFAPTMPRISEYPTLPQRRGWAHEDLHAIAAKQSSQTISGWLLATAVLWVGIPGSFIAAYVATGYPAAAPFADLAAILLLQLWLAWLDGNKLEAQGYQRTSAFWAFLCVPVYFIIRTVRVGGGGVAALLINLLVLGISVSVLSATIGQALTALGV